MASLYSPASILAALSEAADIHAHVAKLKTHLAEREANHARLTGGCKASNSKVINQLKREIATFGG